MLCYIPEYIINNALSNLWRISLLLIYTNTLLRISLTFATAYAIQPISLAINKQYSESYIQQNDVILFLIQWIANELFGFFEYYSLFSKNKGDVFFNYFDSPAAITGNVALSMMMVFSFSSVIIPGVNSRNSGL